jgi:hypothetical protein
MRATAILVVVFATSAGCASDSGGNDGRDAGADAAWDGAADAAADSSVADAKSDPPDAGCSGGYDLPSYSGDTTGLCPPDDATMCSCFELTQIVAVTCDPSGGGCVQLPAICNVCGWVKCPKEVAARPPACDQYDSILPSVWAGPASVPCSRDAHCKFGTMCSVRVGDRMFCSPL